MEDLGSAVGKALCRKQLLRRKILQSISGIMVGLERPGVFPSKEALLTPQTQGLK